MSARLEVQAYDVIDVLVADIRVEARLRPISQSHVDHLKARMLADGVTTTITITQQPGKSGYTLVDGLHRLTAVTQLEILRLKAVVIPADAGWDGYAALINEATLNLARHDLSPYDRASSVAGVYQALLLEAGVAKGESPRKLGGSARWLQARKIFKDVEAAAIRSVYLPKSDHEEHPADLRDAPSVTKMAQEICQISSDKFERLIFIYGRLRPDLSDQMRTRDGWLVASVLYDCAKLDESEQSKLADLLSSDPEIGLKAALAVVKPSTSVELTAEDKAFRAIKNGFRLTRPERQAAVLFDCYCELTDGAKAKFAAMIAGEGEDA